MTIMLTLLVIVKLVATEFGHIYIYIYIYIYIDMRQYDMFRELYSNLLLSS